MVCTTVLVLKFYVTVIIQVGSHSLQQQSLTHHMWQGGKKAKAGLR